MVMRQRDDEKTKIQQLILSWYNMWDMHATHVTLSIEQACIEICTLLLSVRAHLHNTKSSEACTATIPVYAGQVVEALLSRTGVQFGIVTSSLHAHQSLCPRAIISKSPQQPITR